VAFPAGGSGRVRVRSSSRVPISLRFSSLACVRDSFASSSSLIGFFFFSCDRIAGGKLFCPHVCKEFLTTKLRRENIMGLEKERERYVYLAKLSEQAERYDG
jgi:hypothetical protein